jgi:hypothetical protein
MDIKLPDNLLENLNPDETVIDSLKTATIASRPDYTVLTNQRIIYFNAKYLGRYELATIPYQKLERMVAERGMLRFGTITFVDENEEEIALNRVPKDQIESFINSLEEALNMIAVEPISIKRNKGLGGRMNWEFNKPQEMLYRTTARPAQSYQSQQDPSKNQDPLQVLKMRYARGEISEEEYEKMREALSR